MKNSNLTVTDQFCGAGGSSQGVRLVAAKKKLNTGLEVKLAMNHWKLAIETHNTNFPETEHVCTDISACDPRRYHSTTMLITSPECTVHSPAGGGQAKKKQFGNQIGLDGRLASEIAEERSRATMWDVCRFAEYHKYELIICENVVEARKWVLFDNWLKCMIDLGYNHKIKYINSMHAHPTPQSRDRMYIVFWKKGNKEPDLNFNPVAACHKCCKNIEAYQHWKNPLKQFGKYRTQYIFKCPDCHETVEPYFYAAFNCIDWSKPGTRIGDRKKKLSDKTEKRCQYGIDKYWDEPSFINVKFSSGIDFRVKSASDNPLTTQPTDNAVGILNPMVISSRYIQGIGNRVKESGQSPLPTQVTDGRESVIFSPLIGSRHGQTNDRIKDSKESLPTQLSDGHESILFPPMIMNSEYGKNEKIISSDKELFTQTTQASSAVILPPLITDGGWDKSKRVNEADKDPLSTQDTGQTKGVILPFLIKNYTSDHHMTLKSDSPLGSITGVDHHSIVNPPLIVENVGSSKARPAADRLPAVTTNAKHGIITADKFNSFISYYYGGSLMASHSTEPIRAVTTKDRMALINEPYNKPRLEDCYYRMLLPHEIQIGMAFDANYIVLGDSKQKVKQLGNAVTPPVMEFLVGRCIETLQ